MSSHTTHYGIDFNQLRGALHTPWRRATTTRQRLADGAVSPDWLDRLAVWAERQPMHHRMGSYLRLR